MSYSSTVLADSPYAYYRMDDANPTLVDVSGAARNGTYYGSLYVQSVVGLISDWSGNTATRFTGGFAIPPSLALGTGDVTLECWLKVPATAGTIVMIGSPYWLGLATGLPTYNASVTGATRIDDNAVHHVVLTRISGVTRLYVDGSLAATGAGGDIGDQTAVPDIGAYTQGYTFPGTLDEVAFYTAGLSAARVLAHYAAGTGGVFPWAGDVGTPLPRTTPTVLIPY